ncbi:MAG: DUF4282 domain-containing protein [Gemmatimonadales bacterium]
MDQRGLVSSLFDLTFDHMITPRIQRVLYALMLVMAAVIGLGAMVTVGGMLGKIGGLFVGVPVGGLVFLLLAMYFRVMMEIMIVVFKAVEYLREIAAATRGGANG